MFGGNGQSVFGDNTYLNRARSAEDELEGFLVKTKKLNAELEDVKKYKIILGSLVSSSVTNLSATRGLLREVLVELEHSDHDNPILKKECRDAIYESIYDQVNASLKSAKIDDIEKDIRSGKYKMEAFGVTETSTLSGPEMSMIKENKALRAKAKHPVGHVSDRDKMVDIVNRLSAEIKKSEPSTSVLKSIISEAKV